MIHGLKFTWRFCSQKTFAVPEDFQAASLGSHKLSDAAHQGPLDEFARFNLWTGNTGAHHRGRSCLDWRLRDASHLRDPVVNLLTDLKSTLHDSRYNPST
ncbi:hypothetical protein F4801DRAFT_565095 [Xylaria longipes]|nr:hypothetical protein F4801DRAFT_565095 [Xylaria longipes]